MHGSERHAVDEARVYETWDEYLLDTHPGKYLEPVLRKMGQKDTHQFLAILYDGQSIVNETLASRMSVDSFAWIRHDCESGYLNLMKTMELFDTNLAIGGSQSVPHSEKSFMDGSTCGAIYRFLRFHPDYDITGIIKASHHCILTKRNRQYVWTDRRNMYRTVLSPGGCGLELGVQFGSNAAGLLETARPVVLWLVDKWSYDPSAPRLSAELMESRYQRVCERFQTDITDGRVRILRMMGIDAAQQIPDHSLDWIYIDAGHMYSEVKTDLECYDPKIKPGGILMGHDYSWHISAGGVIHAVNEFLLTHPNYTWLGLCREVPHVYQSFALRKNG